MRNQQGTYTIHIVRRDRCLGGESEEANPHSSDDIQVDTQTTDAMNREHGGLALRQPH